MLKHEPAIHKIKSIRFESFQMRSPIESEPTPIRKAVPAARTADHRMGDVHADRFVEITGECLGDATNATAEVEGSPFGKRRHETLHTLHQP